MIHILDDDHAVLRSLDRLVRSAGYLTRLYESPFELLDVARDISGCILLDVRMPHIGGIEVQERLRDGPCPVILMTGHADVEMAIATLRSGAVDLLEKPFSDERLFAAIETALQKARERPVQLVAQRAAGEIARLSPREHDVLDALVRGESHKVIAHTLGISVRTVEQHRMRMLHRLGTRHLADAIKLAVLAELALDFLPHQ